MLTDESVSDSESGSPPPKQPKLELEQHADAVSVISEHVVPSLGDIAGDEGILT